MVAIFISTNHYLYCGGSSVIPDIWLVSLAKAYKRLERRLR